MLFFFFFWRGEGGVVVLRGWFIHWPAPAAFLHVYHFQVMPSDSHTCPANISPEMLAGATLCVSVWHRWHSYRQLMCERARPMPVALSRCSPHSPFTLHFCQMCNIYSLLSCLRFCSEAYMTLVDMLLVILSSLVRQGWQTNTVVQGH